MRTRGTTRAVRPGGAGTWWRGTRLVAARALTEQLRSRTFKVVTGLLLVMAVAGITVPQLLGEDDTVYTLTTVGEADPELVQALGAAQAGQEFRLEFDERADRAAVREAVRDGETTAGLVGDTLFTQERGDGTFPVLVAQAVVALESSARLADAGLTPAQVVEVQSVRPPQQVPVGAVADSERAGAGFLVGIVLYLAITFAGSGISTAVAQEKTSRISEVLLTTLRPSQALVGTVAATGMVTLLQLAVLTVPLAVAVRVNDSIGLPPVAAGDLALALVWFVLGFALYAFVFAASASVVDKVTEANSAIVPVMSVLVAAYLAAVTFVGQGPGTAGSVITSLFPFSAPIAMPIRWATGEVPVYQLVLAMVLTAATALLLVRLASAAYSRGLLITGRRAGVREVLGSGRAGSGVGGR